MLIMKLIVAIPQDEENSERPHCYVIDEETQGEKLNVGIDLKSIRYFDAIDGFSKEQRKAFLTMLDTEYTGDFTVGGSKPRLNVYYLQQLYAVLNHQPVYPSPQWGLV